MANVILGLLLLHPQTIYDLNKQFESSVSLFYSASLGALRSALLGLLSRGHVEFDEIVERGRAKKVYRITPEGREAFAAWMRGPISGSNLETAALSKLFFLGSIPEAAERRAILADIADRAAEQLSVLEATEASASSVPYPPEFAQVAHYRLRTLAYGLGSTRFALEFFAGLRDAELVPDAASAGDPGGLADD